uniref:Uncharacterized protein n=1 Tax=Vespula pensylvanica TaxID=30213 RepID=A0A834PA41_VESPE|nr:hypothetical protein H0235_002715 [Vespula pensylvanica]
MQRPLLLQLQESTNEHKTCQQPWEVGGANSGVSRSASATDKAHVKSNQKKNKERKERTKKKEEEVNERDRNDSIKIDKSGKVK